MKKKFADRKLVKVYLEEAEYKWIELQASGNISHWCREQMLADYSGAERPAQAGSDLQAVRVGENPPPIPVEPSPSERATAPNPSKKVKVCAHGTEKGYNCWQCGGIAKVNAG